MNPTSTILTSILLIALTLTATAQFNWTTDIAPAHFKHITKKPGHYTAEDWATVIDTTWGEGLPTETKLHMFDLAWNKLNADYAAFQNLDVDWNAQRDLYRPEIEAGVSRGRFAAIMNYLCFTLRETHTYIQDRPVWLETPLEPGVPLFVVGSPGSVSHFGAALSPLPDSSLLVIKTLPDHPLDLVPGDIVLGYNGIPWKDLYSEILEAQLPFSATGVPVSSESANKHILLTSAGMNWHLFDTLDVVIYVTNDTLHFPTALLAGQTGFIWANEQLPVPGVPWPDVNQGENIKFGWDLGDYVSWGVIEDTQIGYIYLTAVTPDWQSDIGEEFYNAVDSLMNHHSTQGLILDIRLNYGGHSSVDDAGLSLLFNSYIQTIGMDERCGDPDDHFQMCNVPRWTESAAMKGEPGTFYDKPIAVLTGPGSMSMGDQLSLIMKYHPMARLFGKSSAGAFSAWSTNFINLGNDDWMFACTEYNAYLLSNPGIYLTHTDLQVDEEVWLTQEDVAKGEDTVVKRAIEWIQNLAYAHDVTVDRTYTIPEIEEVVISTVVENPNQHELSFTAVLNNMDNLFIDSLSLFDDGMHGDGEANDNLLGTTYMPTAEQSYKVSVTTHDNDEETSRTLPNIAWFTTIGRIKLSGCQITSSDTIPNPGDYLAFRFELHNQGLQSTATNITTKIIPLDTCASLRSTTVANYGDMAPDEIVLGDRSQYIQFSDKCTDIYQTQFAIEIYSNGYHFWSDTFKIDVVSTIERYGDLIPKTYSLHQNFPNPFNPTTMIKYQIPATSDVELSIYNLLGQKVATLVNEQKRAGYHQIEWDATGFASGLYYYSIEAGNFIEIRKMIYLK